MFPPRGDDTIAASTSAAGILGVSEDYGLGVAGIGLVVSLGAAAVAGKANDRPIHADIARS